MENSKKIKLSDLGSDKKMDPKKLSQLKGGIEIGLFAACTSGVCSKKYEDEKDAACAKTDQCRSGAPKVPTTNPDGNVDQMGGHCSSRSNG